MIRIVFTKSNDWVSKAIRFFTRSKTSHVGLWIDDEQVLSAEADGIKQQSLQDFMKGREFVGIFEVKPEYEYMFDIEKAKKKIGWRYDFVGLLGFMYVELWERLNRRVRNPLASKNMAICSEFVLATASGLVPEFANMSPETTDPGDLFESLEKGGPTFKAISIYNSK
jgi:hypothetical protein